jgi:fido (protein-threonine AMPylation protein)
MPNSCPDWSQPESDTKLLSVVLGMNGVSRFILKRANSFVLHHGTLREWHLQLFKTVVPLTYYAGNFRCQDISRPCLAAMVYVGGMPGSPFQVVESEMGTYSGTLRAFIQSTDTYFSGQPSFANRVSASLQLASWAVGRFIQIHPFLNGNGRISRLLANYFFVRYGFPIIPSFHNIARPGGDYASAMSSCMGGDFVPLYKYFVLLLASN